MPRPKAGTLNKCCVICSNTFQTPDTIRGRKVQTCSKSCTSKLSYSNQYTVTGKCNVCGTETKTSKSVLNSGLPIYCSELCKKNKIRKHCHNCNEEFSTDRYGIRFCSQKCVIEHAKSNLVVRECYRCGMEFSRPTFTVTSTKRVFCSNKCNNAQYANENPSRYGGTWRRWSKDVKNRDNHQCLLCGSVEDLEAHHFIKMTSFEDPNDAHYWENLGTFCRGCHEDIEDSSISDLNDFYIRYSPTPQETVGDRQK